MTALWLALGLFRISIGVLVIVMCLSRVPSVATVWLELMGFVVGVLIRVCRPVPLLCR